MKKYAEVISGTVVLIREFADSHIPQAALPVQFIELPDDHQVMPGDLYSDGFSRQEVNIEGKIEGNKGAITEAMHSYLFKYLGHLGSAMIAEGVRKEAPKCIACKQWCELVAATYYGRIAVTTHEENTSHLDFSVCGPMPNGLMEIHAEAYE